MTKHRIDFVVVERFEYPVVTVIEYCLAFIPVAKALRAVETITLSLGVGMPREMQRFSRML